MENTGRKTLGKGMYIGGMVALGIIMVIGGFTIFPVIEYRGNTIRMFAPERLLGRMPRMNEITRPWEPFDGRVLGEHVLRTEHGEITLGHFSHIQVGRSGLLFRIDVENFRRGRASHSLVVEGIVMPQNVSITFDTLNNQRIYFLALNRQEVHISGIPFDVATITIDSPRFDGDISLGVHSLEDITLADGTRISFGTASERFVGFLFIHKDEERWVLSRRQQSALRISRGGGFTEYRSVTFEPNWGAFIEGVPVQ